MDELDFRAIFEATPGPYLVVDPGWVIVAVNDAYLAATMTVREKIVGRHIFDAFPDPPDDPTADGVANLTASLTHVRDHLEPHRMATQKYDIRRVTGDFEERYWSPLNTPVLGVDGELRCIVHHVEDVTAVVAMAEREAIRASAIVILRVIVLLLATLAVTMGVALLVTR